MPCLLAHVGHWSIWVLYALPVIAVLIVISVGVVRERRGQAGHDEQPSSGPDAGAPDEVPPDA